MSSLLYDSIARIARHEAGARAVAAVGVVTDVHPGSGTPPDHAVTVKLRDSGLILPRVPVTAGATGLHALPRPDDLVLVVFSEGDYDAPIVVGLLYHADLAPPALGADVLGLHLPAGSSSPDLKLEVTPDPAAIRLELPGDVLIEAKDGLVDVKVGEMRLTLTGSGGGRAELKAGGTTLVLKQDADLEIKSAARLKIQAAEIELSASGTLKLQGAQVQVN